MGDSDSVVQQCALALEYGCRFWLETGCRAYNSDGVVFRGRMDICPLGDLPPKVASTPTQKTRFGQQKSRRKK